MTRQLSRTMTWAWAWACDGVRSPGTGDRAHLCIMMCWPCVRGRRAPLLSVPYVLRFSKCNQVSNLAMHIAHDIAFGSPQRMHKSAFHISRLWPSLACAISIGHGANSWWGNVRQKVSFPSPQISSHLLHGKLKEVWEAESVAPTLCTCNASTRNFPCGAVAGGDARLHRGAQAAIHFVAVVG